MNCARKNVSIKNCRLLKILCLLLIVFSGVDSICTDMYYISQNQAMDLRSININNPNYGLFMACYTNRDSLIKQILILRSPNEFWHFPWCPEPSKNEILTSLVQVALSVFLSKLEFCGVGAKLMVSTRSFPTAPSPPQCLLVSYG